MNLEHSNPVQQSINVMMFLGNAMRHLEDHWPDRVGMNARFSFWAEDSYPDYAAFHILNACRELVRYI